MKANQTDQGRKKDQNQNKNKQITIITVNVRGIKSKVKSIESLLKATKASIELITDKKLDKSQQINIKGYKWIGQSRNRNGGGVGILIKKHNSPTSKRRHNSRWTPRPRYKMDRPGDQAKKHSYRSLLRTSRSKKGSTKWKKSTTLLKHKSCKSRRNKI